MNSRPKAVSFVAICFGLIASVLALTIAYATYRQALHHRMPSLTRIGVLLGIAILYASIARGLWRLSPASRIAAICLAPVNTFYVAYAIYYDHAHYDGIAERMGAVLAQVAMLFSFSCPLYFLTRPVIASAFSKARTPDLGS
jgi:hypothetical protein